MSIYLGILHWSYFEDTVDPVKVARDLYKLIHRLILLFNYLVFVQTYLRIEILFDLSLSKIWIPILALKSIIVSLSEEVYL